MFHVTRFHQIQRKIMLGNLKVLKNNSSILNWIEAFKFCVQSQID